jgi:hypothetical protein
MQRTMYKNFFQCAPRLALVIGFAGLVALNVSCRKEKSKPAPSVEAEEEVVVPSVKAEEEVVMSVPKDAEMPKEPAVQFPVALIDLEPKAAEYGTKPDPDNVQVKHGPGVIDTTPVRPFNNATWFWPDAVKIVRELPPESFEFPQGQRYESARTDMFASEGFFVTGVGLWGRTRNMYHWVEYEIPKGATRFTADVLISDDPFGWFAGRVDKINQQFDFYVKIDDREVKRQGDTRSGMRQGSGAKHLSLDIPLSPGAEVIRFGLEITPWGHGNKNTELIITDGKFSQQ